MLTLFAVRLTPLLPPCFNHSFVIFITPKGFSPVYLSLRSVADLDFKLLYPVAWGLCEGGNVISANYEAIFYGILDLFAKPVFSIALIYGHWSIEPSRLGLRIDDYTDPEKSVPGQHENGNRNGDIEA